MKRSAEIKALWAAFEAARLARRQTIREAMAEAGLSDQPYYAARKGVAISALSEAKMMGYVEDAKS